MDNSTGGLGRIETLRPAAGQAQRAVLARAEASSSATWPTPLRLRGNIVRRGAHAGGRGAHPVAPVCAVRPDPLGQAPEGSGVHAGSRSRADRAVRWGGIRSHAPVTGPRGLAVRQFLVVFHAWLACSRRDWRAWDVYSTVSGRRSCKCCSGTGSCWSSARSCQTCRVAVRHRPSITSQ